MEGVTDSMKITNYTQEFITDDNKPFDRCPCLNTAGIKGRWLLAAMVWRCMEKNPDVAICAQ